MATMDSSSLLCTLCPGQPTFSDKSHLLTHVASKAHLSHQFKLGVRSHQEPDIAQLVAAYNHWFETNNIAGLLADRMSARKDNKNKRRPRGRQTSSTQSTLTTPLPTEADDADVIEGTMPTPLPIQGPVPDSLLQGTSANPATLTTPLLADDVDANANQKEPDDFPDYIDPRLRQPYNPVHQHELAPEEAIGGGFYSVTQSPSLRTAGLQPTDFVTPLANSVVRRTAGSAKNSPAGEVDRVDTASTNKHPGSTNWASQGPIADDLASQNASLPSTPNVFHPAASLAQEIEADDRARELARLKGLVLPGMDVFDAATEQMRRTRNQKKDGTIVKQLEKTSRLVQPTEQIFTPTGVFVKSRVISGNADDDSPVEGESPIPKKGAARGKRGILRDNDPNILLGKGRKRVKRDVSQEQSTESLDDVERDTFIYRNGPFGAAHQRQDEDLGLTTQALQKRRRAGFTVYKDAEEEDEHMDQTVEDNHTQQAPRVTLTPGDTLAARRTFTLAQLDMTNNSNISYNHGHTTETEQSTEAILDTLVHPASPRWDSMTPIVNRSDDHMNDYPLPYLSDQTSPNDFNLNDHEGYYWNPLRGPRPPETIAFASSSDNEEEQTMAGWGGWTSASRAISSDATISEDLYPPPTHL
ncbi:uncharacterized protein N7496_011216 [Penicillium cataractarum]|uniref:Uncharacterized protein n=1 Tax=Penicillium cataractarum TaxID=2100454 RepID=A0A9W9REJ7_9EURO|nr:uncharacterized protein N7496_011216 [Penicillium cataractarum]KAJ5358803.1 hypothetical protein N7496_011216 [Penicillium cataractarum]